MDFFFECPKCHGPLITQSEWAGNNLPCPHCHTVLVLPGNGAPPTAMMAAIDAALVATQPSSNEPGTRLLRRLKAPTGEAPSEPVHVVKTAASPAPEATRGKYPPLPPPRGRKAAAANTVPAASTETSPTDLARLLEENARLKERLHEAECEIDELRSAPVNSAETPFADPGALQAQIEDLRSELWETREWAIAFRAELAAKTRALAQIQPALDRTQRHLARTSGELRAAQQEQRRVGALRRRAPAAGTPRSRNR